MLRIDYRDNISLHIRDNAIINFSLCGCPDDALKQGDIVFFHSAGLTREPSNEITVDEFTDGIAKIHIPAYEEPYSGRYCIRVRKADGREETVIDGNFIRIGGC